MSSDYQHLNPSVVYDVLTYDVKWKRQFMLSNEISLKTGGSICGPAFTVHGVFTPNRLAPYEERAVVIDMLGAMSEGVVEVLQPNYQGPLGSWGDFTATLVRHYGCVGAVVDGNTRDIAGLREMDFPLYCKGTSLVNGFGSGWQIDGFLEPVSMPGPSGMPVVVNPGDFIVGNDDGVVVVPHSILDETAGYARKRLDREAALKEELGKGKLTQAYLKTTIFDW